MNKLKAREDSILQEYEALKEKLLAFGEFIDNYLISLLAEKGFDLSRVQIPPKARLKTNSSLLGRALYRDINSSDPLKRIEDKIATRIVVTSVADAQQVAKIVEESDGFWKARVSRNLEKNLKNPKEFDYQAIHVNLFPKEACSIFIESSKSHRSYYICELQIRTLLQHAFAEVAHDTIYKGPYSKDSALVRLLSRGQALMEVTDEHFQHAYEMTNDAQIYEKAFLSNLIDIGNGLVNNEHFKLKSVDQNFTREVFETFEVEKIDVKKVDRAFQQRKDTIIAILKSYPSYILSQPASLLIMYKIVSNLIEVKAKWSYDPEILEDLLFYLGYSRR